MQAPDMTVAALREHVRAASGLQPEQQVLVIAEDRARLPGLGKIAKRVQTSLQTTRQDLRAAVIAWVNFVFLPEAFNRYWGDTLSFVCAKQAYASMLQQCCQTSIAVPVLSGLCGAGSCTGAA